MLQLGLCECLFLLYLLVAELKLKPAQKTPQNAEGVNGRVNKSGQSKDVSGPAVIEWIMCFSFSFEILKLHSRKCLNGVNRFFLAYQSGL